MKGSLRVFLLISVIFLTSCSSPTQQDTSAHAILDRENNIIIKPIAEYELSTYSLSLYNRIIDKMYEKCLAQKGITYTPTEPLVPTGSREYGFWNSDYIEKYGYGIFEPFTADAPLTPKEQKEFEACYNTQEITSHHQNSLEFHKKTEISENILTEARGHALKNPAWQEARKKWWACLADKGLTPRTGDDAWGTEQALQVDTSSDSGKQEAVRIALIEANCSQETGMAQTLADLEASYQIPLIKENQSALNEAKTAVQEFAAEMERIYQTSQ